MADSIPPCSHTGVDNVWIDVADRRVHDQGAGHPEIVKDGLEPPEANPLAILMPGPVGDVRDAHSGPAGWGDNRARHWLADHPVLDIHAGPDNQPGTVRQRQGLALGNGHVVDAISGPAKLHTLTPQGTTS